MKNLFLLGIFMLTTLPMLYASTEKVSFPHTGYYDSLQRRTDLTQPEIPKNVEKDRAESSKNLKKLMTSKTYTAASVNNKKSSATMTTGDDVIYTVKRGEWIVIE